MIFRLAIAPWNDCRFSTLNFKRSLLEQEPASSSELLATHATLLKQRLQLQARLKDSASAVRHYRNQFLEHSTRLESQLTSSQQYISQLLETRAKYDKPELAAQVTQEDPMLRSIVAHACP